jgi:hypothetical protein
MPSLVSEHAVKAAPRTAEDISTVFILIQSTSDNGYAVATYVGGSLTISSYGFTMGSSGGRAISMERSDFGLYANSASDGEQGRICQACMARHGCVVSQNMVYGNSATDRGNLPLSHPKREFISRLAFGASMIGQLSSRGGRRACVMGSILAVG